MAKRDTKKDVAECSDLADQLQGVVADVLNTSRDRLGEISDPVKLARQFTCLSRDLADLALRLLMADDLSKKQAEVDRLRKEESK